MNLELRIEFLLGSYWQRLVPWIPTWETLKAFHSSKLVRSSGFWVFFVPIAAKVLDAVRDVVVFEVFGRDLAMALPFSWQIFFAAALAFGAANLIFSWRCPNLVKDFTGAEDFQRSGRGTAQALNEVRPFLNRIGLFDRDGNRVLSSEWLAQLMDEVACFKLREHGVRVLLDPGTWSGSSQDRSLPLERIPNVLDGFSAFEMDAVNHHPGGSILPAVFWRCREMLAVQRPLSRINCALLYLVGSLGFGLVILQQVLFVLRHVFR